MRIQRFSAVEQFGVPIDSPKTTQSMQGVLDLLAAYEIEGAEVSLDLTDITPYYWRNPVFRYFASRQTDNGAVAVDLLPAHIDSEAYLVSRVDTALVAERGIRRVIVPNDQEMMAILGPGPRFAGQICIHEAIVAVG